MKFEKIKKKYALSNSYFKNRRPQDPATPLEVLYYFQQHQELPFKYDLEENENWMYDCFVEYQKRAGVFNLQFFTPPATAKRMAEIAQEYFYQDSTVLDACCGFGMLTMALSNQGFVVKGFDIDSDLEEMYKELTANEFTTLDFTDYKCEKYNGVVSNPPYEIKELTAFFEALYDNILAEKGMAILLIPKGFIDKQRPKATVEILSKFNVLYRENMTEDFERTKIRAEIVVISKK